ncbi:MAG: hypothetical protein P8H33_06535 [Crocinitomicaceae bacterium]|nr:hypothetical protein [Crocinitomicaceae bacterium]
MTRFLKSSRNSLELTALNTYFEYENPTTYTVKKRRENSLESIRQKIETLSAFNFDEVLIESKSPIDKRVKVLTMNPKLIG